MPIDEEKEKIALLKKEKIGLWDIVASCERTNSSDTNLKNCTLCDIPTLLKEYPSIKQIAFTGQKALKLYEKEYKSLHIKTIALPSPSPAYASMRFEEKARIYKERLGVR